MKQDGIEQDNALLFFYTGERKNPEKLSDNDWCKRVEQVNWVLRHIGTIQDKK